MSTRRLLPLLFLTATFVGCARFPSPTTWWSGRSVPEETNRNPADRCLAVWQATDGRGMNGVPSRGFGGQILFFPIRGETPVKVNGDVRIYVFDDQGDAEEQAKPIHQFDFKDGSWNKQLVQGSLGPTYQIFIPYTREGAHEARCSLRLKYSPKLGPAVYSEIIDVRLPGNEKKAAEPETLLTRRSTPRKEFEQGAVDTIRLDRSRNGQPRLRTAALPAEETEHTSEVRQASAEIPVTRTDTRVVVRDVSMAEGREADAARIARLERMVADLTAEKGLTAETDLAQEPTRPSTPVRLKPARSTPIQPARHEAVHDSRDDERSHPFNAPPLGQRPGNRTKSSGDHPLGGEAAADERRVRFQNEVVNEPVVSTGAAPAQRFRLAGQPTSHTPKYLPRQFDAPRLATARGRSTLIDADHSTWKSDRE